jgi:hypothetical protein
MARGRLHPIERRLDVDIHHVVHVAAGEIKDGARDAAARIVDPNIEAAEFGDRPIGESVDFVAFRYIRQHRDRTR